ncbi:MAG: ankyrin repeat domain-containing protein [Spirochaetales bacterium]|nr:ankyrin repeat domain-containing protein [Spirochaetales bacterium]
MKRFFSCAGLILLLLIFPVTAADVPSRAPALIWAARYNLIPLATAMLARGTAVNERDLMQNTPLHWAVKHPEMLQFLIENGADVNAVNFLGETPLHLAVADKRSVEILLKSGADKKRQTLLGRTAADYCMDRGPGRRNLEVMMLLYAE